MLDCETKIDIIEKFCDLRFRHAFCNKCKANTHSITAVFTCGHNYCVDCAYAIINKCKICTICLDKFTQ